MKANSLIDGAEYSEAAALRKAERAARREKSFTGTEGLPQQGDLHKIAVL